MTCSSQSGAFFRRIPIAMVLQLLVYLTSRKLCLFSIFHSLSFLYLSVSVFSLSFCLCLFSILLSLSFLYLSVSVFSLSFCLCLFSIFLPLSFLNLSTSALSLSFCLCLCFLIFQTSAFKSPSMIRLQLNVCECVFNSEILH